MVATIVFGLYGTVGGTVYYVVKTAAANGRLEVRGGDAVPASAHRSDSVWLCACVRAC
jgi:hypothetical protein